MAMMKSLIALLTVAIFVLSIAAAPGDKKPAAAPATADVKTLDIDGYYECKGDNYTGLVVIVRMEDVYVVRWAIGMSTYTGIGMRDEEGALIVGWSNEKMRGVSAFRIEAGPKLVGEWTTLPGDGKKHTERLTFIRGMK